MPSSSPISSIYAIEFEAISSGRFLFMMSHLKNVLKLSVQGTSGHMADGHNQISRIDRFAYQWCSAPETFGFKAAPQLRLNVLADTFEE